MKALCAVAKEELMAIRADVAVLHKTKLTKKTRKVVTQKEHWCELREDPDNYKNIENECVDANGKFQERNYINCDRHRGDPTLLKAHLAPEGRLPLADG